MNPVTGEKKVSINGKPYVLRFTWAALAEMEAKHGDNPNLLKPDILASVAESGFRQHHPEMTAERIMELSPPMVPFAKAVQEAIKWACFGGEPVPESTQKKSLRSAGGWRTLFSRLLPRE